MGGEDADKIVRDSADDLTIKLSPEEEKYREKYLPDPKRLTDEKLVCTVCSVPLASDIHKGKTVHVHRALKVLVCEACFNFYGDGCFSTDEDGDDKYCRWCGQGGTLFLCSGCNCAFCQKCVKQNLKASVLAELEKDDWKCYFCNPRPLYGCRTICWGALELNKIGMEKEKDRLKKQKERLEKLEEKKRELEEIKKSRKLNQSSEDEQLTKRQRAKASSDSSSSEVMPTKKSRTSEGNGQMNGSVNKSRRSRRDSESDSDGSYHKRVTRTSRSLNKKTHKHSDPNSDEESDRKSKSRLQKKKSKDSSEGSSSESNKKTRRKSTKKKPETSDDESSDEKPVKKKRLTKRKKGSSDSSSDTKAKKKKGRNNVSSSEESSNENHTKKNKKQIKKKKKNETSSDESNDESRKSKKKHSESKKKVEESDSDFKKGKKSHEKNADISEKFSKLSAEEALIKKRIKLAVLWLSSTVKDISDLGSLIAIRATKFGKKKINTQNLKTYEDVLNVVSKLKQLISGIHSNYEHIEKSLESHVKPWKELTGIEESQKEKNVEDSSTAVNKTEPDPEEATADEQQVKHEIDNIQKDHSVKEIEHLNNDAEENGMVVQWSGLSADEDSNEDDMGTKALISKANETLEKEKKAEDELKKRVEDVESDNGTHQEKDAVTDSRTPETVQPPQNSNDENELSQSILDNAENTEKEGAENLPPSNDSMEVVQEEITENQITEISKETKKDASGSDTDMFESKDSSIIDQVKAEDSSIKNKIERRMDSPKKINFQGTPKRESDKKGVKSSNSDVKLTPSNCSSDDNLELFSIKLRDKWNEEENMNLKTSLGIDSSGESDVEMVEPRDKIKLEILDSKEEIKINQRKQKNQVDNGDDKIQQRKSYHKNEKEITTQSKKQFKQTFQNKNNTLTSDESDEDGKKIESVMENTRKSKNSTRTKNLKSKIDVGNDNADKYSTDNKNSKSKTNYTSGEKEEGTKEMKKSKGNKKEELSEGEKHAKEKKKSKANKDEELNEDGKGTKEKKKCKANKNEELSENEKSTNKRDNKMKRQKSTKEEANSSKTSNDTKLNRASRDRSAKISKVNTSDMDEDSNGSKDNNINAAESEAEQKKSDKFKSLSKENNKKHKFKEGEDKKINAKTSKVKLSDMNENSNGSINDNSTTIAESDSEQNKSEKIKAISKESNDKRKLDEGKGKKIKEKKSAENDSHTDENEPKQAKLEKLSEKSIEKGKHKLRDSREKSSKQNNINKNSLSDLDNEPDTVNFIGNNESDFNSSEDNCKDQLNSEVGQLEVEEIIAESSVPGADNEFNSESNVEMDISSEEIVDSSKNGKTIFVGLDSSSEEEKENVDLENSDLEAKEKPKTSQKESQMKNLLCLDSSDEEDLEKNQTETSELKQDSDNEEDSIKEKSASPIYLSSPNTSDSEIIIKRKRKPKSTDSDASITLDEKPKQKSKRKRVKMANSSDESGGSSGEEEGGKKRKRRSSVGESPGKGGRKNIKKIKGKDDLADATKEAAEEEKERRRRVEERQKLFNEVFEVKEAHVLEKLVLDFDLKEKKELLSVDKTLVSKMKPHQAKGVKFMWDSCFESLSEMKKKKGSGCILAHCMGLGKTFQVISLVHTLLANEEKTGVHTVMVVCPLSTVLNWYNEFDKWLQDVEGGNDIEVFHLTKCKQNPERARELRRWQHNGGVLVMGYEMFRNLTAETNKKFRAKMKKDFHETLVDPGADLVVCDEGHMLKNEQTALSKAMNKIKTLRRIVLTGTPMQNNLNEYHCMVQFVKPNLLGTRKEFLNRFVNPISNGQFVDSTDSDVKVMKRRAHVLHKMLEGLVQRFDYNVLTPFLPPKHEYVVSVCLSELQIKLYQHYLHHYSQQSESNKGGARLFQDWQALGRIWTHPRVLKLSSDKANWLREKKALEESDSEGSLKDFIDDDDSEAETSEDSESSFGSAKSKDDKKKGKANTRGRTSTRSTRANSKNVALLESSDDEKEKNEEEPVVAGPNDGEWWSEFIEPNHLEDINHSGKLVMLFGILKECEMIEDKVLVFSQSLFSLDLIEYFLDKIDCATQEGRLEESIGNHQGTWSKGLDYFRLDGSTSSENRSIWCSNFNREDNPRARLFLISTRAGGLGINLTAANRVIIFDASWNPSHDVQSIFRIYRFGQKKPCYVYRFIAHGTMEEKVYDRQVAKQSMSNRVVDEQQVHRHFSSNDLNELYSFTPPTKVEDRPIPSLPKDVLFAEILKQFSAWIEKYHEHDSMLENVIEEELNEEERKLAWEDYENDKKRGFAPANTNVGGNYNPLAFQIEYLRKQLKAQYPNKPEEELNQILTYQLSLIMRQQQMQMQAAQMQQMQQRPTLNMTNMGAGMPNMMSFRQQFQPRLSGTNPQQTMLDYQKQLQQANLARLQLQQLQMQHQRNQQSVLRNQLTQPSTASSAGNSQTDVLRKMMENYQAQKNNMNAATKPSKSSPAAKKPSSPPP